MLCSLPNQKPVKKDLKKEAAAAKASSSKKKVKDGEEDGSKKRRQKKKKDPNAPKRAMSAFMFFSNSEREVYTKYLCFTVLRMCYLNLSVAV